MGMGVRLRLHPLFFGHKSPPEAAERAYSFPTHRYREKIDGPYAGCSNTVES
jgi:hypothetical protein